MSTKKAKRNPSGLYLFEVTVTYDFARARCTKRLWIKTPKPHIEFALRKASDYLARNAIQIPNAFITGIEAKGIIDA